MAQLTEYLYVTVSRLFPILFKLGKSGWIHRVLYRFVKKTSICSNLLILMENKA